MAESSAPTAGSGRVASLRAASGLILVLAATCFIISFAGELDALLARAVGRPDGSVGLWLDAAIIALFFLFAFAGSVLLRQPLRSGQRSGAVALSALPVGLMAPAIVLAMAGAAGVVMIMPGKVPGAGLFLAGTAMIVAKVVAEELLFRGLLQPLLIRAWGLLPGIVIASIGFTLIHVVGGWRDPASLLNITLASVWFGLLAWRTGGIWAPVLAHAGYNWAEEMLFGASPNPGVGNFGALIDFELVGPAPLGGSIEGLNASLLLTAVLVAIILPLIIRRPFAGAADIKQEKTGQD